MNQLHELQAERNARVQLLRQSQDDAITHLEQVVGSILLKLDASLRADVLGEISKINTLPAGVMPAVHLYGEAITESKREKWRKELAGIEAQIAELEALGEGETNV